MAQTTCLASFGPVFIVATQLNLVSAYKRSIGAELSKKTKQNIPGA